MTQNQGNPGGAAAGWYPDPSGQPQLRWWNGGGWGQETQATPQAAAYGQGLPAAGAYGAGVPATKQASAGNGFSIVGIILGVIAIGLVPIGFGVAGLISGVIAKRRGEPRAKVALAVAAAGTILGTIIGALYFSGTRGF